VVKSTKLGQKYFYDLLGTIKEKKYNPLVALENGKIIYDRYDPSFEVFKAIDEPLSVVKQLENDEYAKMCVSVGTVIEESDPLDDFLRKKYGKVLQIIRSGKYFFDILNRDASKGKSLEFICQAYGIKKEEVAVIGDSPNDLSMFEYSRISIAVKNSYPEVSKKADFITDENYNDGFAKAIYKYILK
jgi:Cof subfamily protein (haloacid dehalogenase superfamily)